MKALLLGLSIILFSTTVIGQDLAERVQLRLNNIRTMTANFSESIHAKSRKNVNSYGTMALRRPGLFRWQTTGPTKQLVVADGRQLWVYDPTLEQASVKRLAQGASGPAGLFLSSYNTTVARHFNITGTLKGQVETYNLEAKSGKAGFSRVKLVFLGDSLSSIELYDQLGQHAFVRFSQVKTNTNVPSSLFQFTPPRGVDVVRQ